MPGHSVIRERGGRGCVLTRSGQWEPAVNIIYVLYSCVMQRQSRPGGSPDNTMASLCLTCGQESDSAGPTHNCLLSPSLTFDNDFIPPAMQSVWSKLWVTLKCSNNHCNFETRLQSPAGAVNQLRNHIITSKANCKIISIPQSTKVYCMLS